MIGRLGARHADAKKRLEAIEKNAPEPFEQDNLTGSESKILQQHHRSWYRIFSLQKWRPVVWAGKFSSLRLANERLHFSSVIAFFLCFTSALFEIVKQSCRGDKLNC